MEERNYGINWLGLFIKVIVFVVVVLLAIWLISKVVSRNKGLTFIKDQEFQIVRAIDIASSKISSNDLIPPSRSASIQCT